MNKIFRSALIIASFASAGFLAGCDKDDPEIEKTAVSEMSGEWYVKFETQNAAGEWIDPSGDGRTTRNVTSPAAVAPLTPCSRGWVGAAAGYKKILTSSTADSESSTLLVTDIFGNPRAINFAAAGTRGNFYSFMVKANADLGAMTFSANGDNLTRLVAVAATAPTTTPAPGCPALPAEAEKDDLYNVTITDGKVIKDGSTPPSGTTTDSIHFMVKFGNDPFNRMYRVSGYRRTGFTEDEH